MPATILSVSRRTDIPAHYMPWFMDRIEKGTFEVRNPFNRKCSIIRATTDKIHSIVFWSKNFGPFLDKGYGEQLTVNGYHLFFNFTINSVHRQLEPNLPPLSQRLDQLATLSETYGPDAIHWRFDPICHYSTAAGQAGDNLEHFSHIAEHAARHGIRVCITSFVDPYRKVIKRMQRTSNLTLVDPPMEQKVEQVTAMAELLSGLGIRLHLCCEKEVLAALPSHTRVRRAECIPVRQLALLYGPDVSFKRDTGQRNSAGCGCAQSKDVGDYLLHPCRNNCLYCYANPSDDIMQ
jgi:hypothetical protein